MSCLKFTKTNGAWMHKMATEMCFSPSLLFQNGKVASEGSQNQQHLDINFDKMFDLINEELVSAWDIMFWKRTSNPQSGEKYDHRNETYTL